MPYVHFVTSLNLDAEGAEKARQIIGECITLIPGKVFAGTLVEITGGANIAMGASKEPCAFLEARLFGPAATGAKESLAAALSEKMQAAFGVDPGKFYMNFIEMGSWASRGAYRTF